MDDKTMRDQLFAWLLEAVGIQRHQALVVLDNTTLTRALLGWQFDDNVWIWATQWGFLGSARYLARLLLGPEAKGTTVCSVAQKLHHWLGPR